MRPSYPAKQRVAPAVIVDYTINVPAPSQEGAPEKLSNHEGIFTIADQESGGGVFGFRQWTDPSEPYEDTEKPRH